jgi:SPP1 gp7 family putative phage head morphogenesis protein
MGVALQYAGVLRSWLNGFQTLILEQVLGDWEKNPVAFAQTVPAARSDASEFVRRKIGHLQIQLEEKLDPAQLTPQIQKFAKQVDDKGKAEFKRLIGIPTTDILTGVKLAQFRDRNVDLIKSLAATQLDDVRSILDEAEKGAWRVEALRGQILDAFGGTKARASLIARDQVLKLNGQLVETRQTGAGITQYIWTTSHDERVRGTPGGKNPIGLHYDLDGTIQSWAAPPEISEDGRVGHPGSDYQCRCTAFPILPELDED